MSPRSLCLWALGWFVNLMFLGYGCSGGQVKPQNGSGYPEPSLEYRGIDFENQSFMGTVVAFRFELASQDSRPARITDCPYRLELEEIEAITGSVTPAGELVGQGKLPISASVAVPWPENRSEVLAFLARERIPYKFLLECNIAGPTGSMTVSASDSGSIPLPKLPRLTVTGANAERFGRKDIRLNFEISILNENSFKLTVDKIVYKISVEGKPLAQGELPVAEVISPSNETSYDISTDIRSGQASQEILDLVAKPSIAYQLEGKVFMSDFEIAIQDTGTISFSH